MYGFPECVPGPGSKQGQEAEQGLVVMHRIPDQRGDQVPAEMMATGITTRWEISVIQVFP